VKLSTQETGFTEKLSLAFPNLQLHKAVIGKIAYRGIVLFLPNLIVAFGKGQLHHTINLNLSGTQNRHWKHFISEVINCEETFTGFGEVAMSQSGGGTGAVLGFISSLSKQVDISFFFGRNYDSRFP